MQQPTAHELTLLLDWMANAETFDAWEDVDEMVNKRPEDAWRLIRDMGCCARSLAWHHSRWPAGEPVELAR